MPAPGKGFDLVEGYRSLDVRALARQGLLGPGISSGWHWWRRGRSMASATIATEEDRLFLDYHPTGESFVVEIEQTPCTFGGARHWFRCPSCGARRAILYFGWRGLGCRECLRLNFKSQRESRTDRLLRRAEGIRQRLGWPPGIANPPGSKPRSMPWRKYWNLVAEHDRLADAALGAMTESFQRQFPQVRARR